jgi:hypothetical protein
MWSAFVKELFHPFNHVLRYTLNTGMLKPMLRSILGKWKFVQAVSGGASIDMQYNAQTCLGDEGMSDCR